MSAEDDTELRDLVIQTLESKGVIGKIKAELRASVFLALEEHDGLGNGFKQHNKELHDFLATDKGWTMASLVREFLQYFHLDFTLAVFDPEICAVRGFLPRKQLCEQMKLEESKINNVPVLAELVQVVLTPPTDISEEKSQVPDILPEQENQKELLQDSRATTPKQDEIIQEKEKSDENDDFSLKSDPFYDDLVPAEKKLDFFSFKKDKDISTRRPDSISDTASDVSNFVIKDTKLAEGKSKQNFSALSSLQDLPSLGKKSTSMNAEFTLNYGSKEIPHTRDEDYEDDFYSSLSNHSGKSGQHEVEIKGDSSEHSVEEEIEEDLSGDDILNSSISFGDEAATTEHTISQASAVGGYDYIESIT